MCGRQFFLYHSTLFQNKKVKIWLVDAADLDYTRSETDDTQNVVMLELDRDEWSDFKARVNWSPLDTNEQLIGAALLNDELSEYVTKATIYKPNGDKITFE